MALRTWYILKMKVLVCGSRHFNDYELLEKVLSNYEITEIIEGEATGADTLARRFSESKGIPCKKFPAQWDLHGKRAGPIRNAQMLSEGQPDFVIAFRGKNSRGTQNMIDQSKKKNISVRIIEV